MWFDSCCYSNKQQHRKSKKRLPDTKPAQQGLHRLLNFLKLLSWTQRIQMRVNLLQVSFSSGGTQMKLQHQYISGPNLPPPSQAQIKRKALHADAYFPLIRANVYRSRHTVLPPHRGSQGDRGDQSLPPTYSTPPRCLYMISGREGELFCLFPFLSLGLQHYCSSKKCQD